MEKEGGQIHRRKEENEALEGATSNPGKRREKSASDGEEASSLKVGAKSHRALIVSSSIDIEISTSITLIAHFTKH